MVVSNRERVGRALEFLQEGLYPFFERQMKARYGEKWIAASLSFLSENYSVHQKDAADLNRDVSVLFNIMIGAWNDVFKNILGPAERSLVIELRATRNNWAHIKSFTFDDTYRAFDSMSRLLSSVSADTSFLDRQRQEILRTLYEEKAKNETRKAMPTQGQPSSNLKPWREIVSPHSDVASGRYQEAEFAADLWEVYRDSKGLSDEYSQPDEFFRRTYITVGLKELLSNALTRLSGSGGDPVIELQTNFGGGKTHAMLALFHLFSGVKAKDLPGSDEVFQAAGLMEPPDNVNTVVIVGNKISPGKTVTKPDGTEVRTLWGEIAWQLGGKEGYQMVQQADQTSTNPGDDLKELFNRYSPCLILIDEWVAYARQLGNNNEIPGGTFSTQFTFAQTLSESAKNAKNTLLVVSIPASDSDIETGGDNGKQALHSLKNAIGRVESPWRPANQEESFEIVRRRLFQNINDPSLSISRDAVINAYWDMYCQQKSEFPSECTETNYKNRLKGAYPIHPEFFDRLYSDWSTLDKFQRTRGVLRLMAKVINTLWERDDKNLLIMPGHIPMDDPQVQSELTRYLEDGWVPIIEKDVDGPSSLPLELDSKNSNFGRFSACRRVSRTIYLGSAPLTAAANKGLDDKRIKLGCVQPGEITNTFGDALRRLSDSSTYLYEDGNRYWISNQPNVNRTANERCDQLLKEEYKIWAEIVQLLKEDRERGEFGAVHVGPESSADIPDDLDSGVRLVILGPKYSHSKSSSNIPARVFAEEILNGRGNAQRYFKNTLVFLAPDIGGLTKLSENIAQYLAWQSILQDYEKLNLSASQNKQAQVKSEESKKQIDQNLKNAYQWLILPTQPNTHNSVEWEEIKFHTDTESLISKASRKLISEEHLLTSCTSSYLQNTVLNNYIWRENVNHIDLRKLWEYLNQYLYMPRFKNSDVLAGAIRDGLSSTILTDNFACSERWDQERERYINLIFLKNITPAINSQTLLVKGDVAQAQIELQAQEKSAKEASYSPATNVAQVMETPAHSYLSISTPKSEELKKKTIHRFHGNVQLDSQRVNRDVDNIVQEIIHQLNLLKGAEVEISLEIEAKSKEGISEDMIRTLSENCNTLKFKNYGFEPE